MSRAFSFLIIILALLVVAGIAYLATGDLPAPRAPVEKVVPNDRFPR